MNEMKMTLIMMIEYFKNIAYIKIIYWLMDFDTAPTNAVLDKLADWVIEYEEKIYPNFDDE